MKNVTITLSEGVASWLRVYAAQHDKSISKFVGELLNEHMESQLGNKKAMKSYFARSTKNISNGKSYPKREELYDRSNIC